MSVCVCVSASVCVCVCVCVCRYPLYSATLTLYGGSLAPYYLDEANSWGLGLPELEASIKKAKEAGKEVRAIVVINPGNPTGQVLSLDNQKTIVEFCKKEKLILLADEVYQDNIYAEGKEFNSFKKVLRSMGDDYNDVQVGKEDSRPTHPLTPIHGFPPFGGRR